MKLRLITVLLAIVTILVAVSSCFNRNNSDTLPDTVSFNFHIRPIFSDKCFKCHGPDANKRQAGLRLDIPEEAYKALKEHPRAHAIVPFKPDLSEMFLRISSTDTAIRMPPPESNLPALTEGEVAVI